MFVKRVTFHVFLILRIMCELVFINSLLLVASSSDENSQESNLAKIAIKFPKKRESGKFVSCLFLSFNYIFVLFIWGS